MMPGHGPGVEQNAAGPGAHSAGNWRALPHSCPERPVSFSAGVCCHPLANHLETLSGLIGALYQAKAEGRARSVVIGFQDNLGITSPKTCPGRPAQ